MLCRLMNCALNTNHFFGRVWVKFGLDVCLGRTSQRFLPEFNIEGEFDFLSQFTYFSCCSEAMFFLVYRIVK